MIPVVFSTGSLHPFGLERVFAWISAAGFDGVEVMMDERWDTHQEEYLRELSQKHELSMLALHPPIYEGAWRLSPEETLVRAARLAERLEIPTLVAHPPSPGKEFREWREGPLERARERGVTVAVENMPKGRPRGTFGLGGFGGSYLPEHLDGMGEITLDTSHVAASGLDLLEFYSKVRDGLRHVHLSDSDFTGGDQHRFPGKGRLPLLPFLDALARDGYSGAVSLELKPFQSGAPHPEKIMERLSGALSYTRRGLGQKEYSRPPGA